MTLDILSEFAFGCPSDVINQTPADFRNGLIAAFDNAAGGLISIQESSVMRFVVSKIPMALLAN